MKISIVGAVIAFASLLSSSAALADPLVITGGSLTETVSSSPWVFQGDGFFLQATVDSSGAGGLFSSCRPCPSTPPVPLHFSTHASEHFLDGLPGTFGGVSYPFTILEGSLDFQGPTLTSAVLSADNLVLTAPFTMTAQITGYTSTIDFARGNSAFSGSFTGAGTATAHFVMDPIVPGHAPLFDVQSVVYQFASANATPTPEPATLLMLGAGLVIVSTRMRRGM
jgi:hypothetical protein